MGKVLRDHVQSSGVYSARISQCFADHRMGKYINLFCNSYSASSIFLFAVDDEIVIELVEKEIAEFEKKSQSWVMQGFPRTRT